MNNVNEVLEIVKGYYLENGLYYSGSCPFGEIEIKLGLNVNEIREIVQELEKQGKTTEIYVNTYRIVLSKSERKKLILKYKASKLINEWCKLHPHQLPEHQVYISQKEIKTVFSLKPSYI